METNRSPEPTVTRPVIVRIDNYVFVAAYPEASTTIHVYETPYGQDECKWVDAIVTHHAATGFVDQINLMVSVPLTEDVVVGAAQNRIAAYREYGE